MPKSVYDLDVYQRAYKLALAIHKASLNFPQIEQYALAGQMRRASKGICANLAEGFAKSYKSQPEFKRYILIAIGSAEEMQVWLDFVGDLAYVPKEAVQEWKEEYIVVCKQLNKLADSVSRNG
jgi:four helix bundle protein